MEPMIKIENLGKKYSIVQKRLDTTLRETVADTAKNIWQRIRGGSEKKENVDFWALKDINLEVQKGQRLGIIGRNGAGKSTLLKILSRITKPTTGKAILRGKTASLLEVGTGFHPELTGRENIFLNGAILGMKRAETRQQLDAIVDFAEVREFIDTPVKRYSSGMYVRLAFAVAAHLQPEILIVDEVLAVGDMRFQQKCLGKMESVSKENERTLLFVSHNMGAVQGLCDSAILLEEGEIYSRGNPSKVISDYYRLNFQNDGDIDQSIFHGPLTNVIELQNFQVNGERGDVATIMPSEEVEIFIQGIAHEKVPYVRILATIYRGDTRILTLYDSYESETLNPGSFQVRYDFPARYLRPGNYSISIGAYQSAIPLGSVYADNVLRFVILEQWNEENPEFGTGLINLSPKDFSGTRKTGSS